MQIPVNFPFRLFLVYNLPHNLYNSPQNILWFQMKKDWLQKTEEMVKNRLSFDSSGHDWWHIYRVRKLALRIADFEQANPFIVEMAALLHDICDWKFNDGNEKAGLEVVRLFMNDINIPSQEQQVILEIIGSVSYKGAGIKDKMPSLEGRVVQDADRLDALGAIGIARTFAYGGNKNQAMHEPSLEPTLHQSFEDYKIKRSSSINHFYEKLFLLKDRLHTDSAKKIAQERHDFMVNFVDTFLQEWEGER